jgi:HAD superfamily hydrolase (TIGR01509 family)
MRWCVRYSRQKIWIDPLKALRAHHSAHRLPSDTERRVHRRAARYDRSHQRGAGAAPVRPPGWLVGRVRAADDLPLRPRAFVFDVEGTLVDTVLPTLQCWSETLAEIGVTASVADLHPYSGVDGKRMLRHFVKKHDPKLLAHIAELHSERYRIRYLPHVRPFAGLRRLFNAIKSAEAKIALATTSNKDDLARYRAIMEVDDLIDLACCGDDVRREKPAPDIVALVARRLRLPPAEIAMVGDTPYDAEAARAAGLVPVGLQSGHFSRSDLQDGGCAAVFFDLLALAQKLDERAPAAAVAEAGAQLPLRSHTAATADSR